MATVKELLDKEVGELRRARDELRVQAHLGKAEAKEAWHKLEATWPDVERKLKLLETESTEAIDHVAAATRKLLDELRDGYKKLKSPR